MEVHLFTGLPRNNHLLGKLIGQEAQTLCTERKLVRVIYRQGLSVRPIIPVITGYRLTTGYWVPGPVNFGLSHAEDLS